MKTSTIILLTIGYTIYSGFAGVGVYCVYQMTKAKGLTIIAETPEHLNIIAQAVNEATIKQATKAIQTTR
jgi:hypothetical protein